MFKSLMDGNDIAALETRLRTTEKAVYSFEKRLTHLEEHVKTSAAASLVEEPQSGRHSQIVARQIDRS